MQYPLFLSIAEASRVLGRGKTTIFALIKDRNLKAAKMGRSTRITFSSVIQYAQTCLKTGNGSGELTEIFGEHGEIPSWMVAEHFAGQLCHTHREPAEVPGDNINRIDSFPPDAAEPESPEKNFGGEA